MFGRHYRRLKWLFWGEVSRILVEQYESEADAILMPIYGLSCGGSVLWAAAVIYGLMGGVARLLPVALLGLLGGSILGMGVLAAAASVVYATQTTEVDRPMEVHDGRV